MSALDLDRLERVARSNVEAGFEVDAESTVLALVERLRAVERALAAVLPWTECVCDDNGTCEACTARGRAQAALGPARAEWSK